MLSNAAIAALTADPRIDQDERPAPITPVNLALINEIVKSRSLSDYFKDTGLLTNRAIYRQGPVSPEHWNRPP